MLSFVIFFPLLFALSKKKNGAHSKTQIILVHLFAKLLIWLIFLILIKGYLIIDSRERGREGERRRERKRNIDVRENY